MSLGSDSNNSSNENNSLVQQNSTHTSASSKVTPSALTHSSNTYSPSVLNFLEQPPASFPIRFILGGMVFCLAFASWAWFGHVEEVGQAKGKLVPKGKTYKVESTRQGKIEQLLIEEGDAVVAGEVLARLDAEQLRQKINQIEQRLDTYQNQFYQQQNLLQAKRLEVLNGQEIANTNLTIQEIAIANAQDTIRSKSQELEVLKLKVAQNEQRVERLKPLEQQGAISQEYLFQAQQTLQTSKLKRLGIESEINTAEKEAERLQVELTKKNKQKTQSQLEAQQQIKQLEINIEKLKGDILETKNELAIAKTQLDEMLLESPIDGRILSVNFQNIGQVLQSGQTIAEIAPKGTSLILDAAIANQEAGFVEKNMDVKIKFDAYPYQDYGIVQGKVLSISPDSTTNENGTFYKVEIALERNYINHHGDKIYFKSGQTANAEIITRRRRIAEVIFEPFQKLKEGGFNL